jgi:hypothetical protein
MRGALDCRGSRSSVCTPRGLRNEARQDQVRRTDVMRAALEAYTGRRFICVRVVCWSTWTVLAPSAPRS